MRFVRGFRNGSLGFWRVATRAGFALGRPAVYGVMLLWLVLLPVHAGPAAARVVLTPEETDWVTAHPVVDVGIYAGNHFPLEAWVAGAPEGMGADYAKLVASRIGLRLQFRPFTDWDAVAYDDSLQPVPFDLLVGQPYRRSQRLIYLKPYAESEFVMVARKGDQRMLGESDLATARIAMERYARYAPQIVRKRFPDATYVFSDDARQAMDLLAQGQVDAFVGTAGRTRWVLSERERDDIVLLTRMPDLGKFQTSMAVPRDHTMLAGILAKAEATISEDELESLRVQWGYGNDATAPARARHLTSADREWLKSLGTLRVGYETDRVPYSFIDKDGQLSGLAGDYLSLVSKELGLQLEYVPARDLGELQRRVEAKEVDLVAAAMPADFPSRSMVFTRSYERFPAVIVTRINGPAVASFMDLQGKKAAVRNEAGLIASLKMLMPKTELVPVGSNDTGLAMTERGDVAAYIGTLPAIDALIRDRYAASLHVVAPAGLDQDFTFGITSDKARLAGLMDQVIAGIKDDQRQGMRSRWLRADYSYGVPWTWVMIGLAVSASVVLIIGIAYRRVHKAQARAFASEQRLVDTNENLPGAVIRMHVSALGDRSYEYVSGPTLAIFGMVREDILSGRARPFDAVIDEDQGRVQDAVTRTFNLKQPETIEFRTRIDGAIHWVRVLGGEPKPTGQGGYFWSIYCSDVTVEKAQERALVEAKATAEAAVATKGAFLAMMSHEIRTPMAGVLGLVELLSKTDMTTEQSHMVDMVQDSSVALLQILDDILDFSRIEAERMTLEPQPFDLRMMADSALSTFAARAQQKRLYLYLVLDWRLAGEYHGDANRIRQIINNLISNAIKFTASGHVEVRVEMLGETGQAQQLKFSVTDTGIGIPPDQLNRLFQPFTQAEASTTRRFGGTGLGLSICRRLAQIMSGEVTLASEVGKGTVATLLVTLPVLKRQSVQAGMDGKRALVCVRDGLLESGLSNALSALGFNVMETDVEDAADFTQDDVDLYLADASSIDRGIAPAGVPAVHLLRDADPRGTYVEGGKTLLCGSPLMWRSTMEACRTVLGLAGSQDELEAVGAWATSHARILVAEDHPINRAVIERQLDLLGYTCTLVEDGQRALQELADRRYDLLITDCHMPVLDGYELTRRIRAAERVTGAHLPIIALSASALPEQVEKCRLTGMDDFLAKPVRLEELKRTLGKFVDKDVLSIAADVLKDDEQLEQLAGIFGSKEQLSILLKGLLSAGKEDLSRLDDAMADGNADNQRDIIHRIVGSLRLIDPSVMEEKAGEDTAQRRAEIAVRLEHIDQMIR